MIKLVGLKNCDTCKKAQKWLEAEGLDFVFSDVRKDGLSREDLTMYAHALGWEELLNKRGTTWRGLDESLKADVDEARAIDLMVENPALMKRPVFETANGFVLGFKQPQMDELLKLKA